MKKKLLSLITAILLLMGCVFTANADGTVDFDELVGQDKPAAPVLADIPDGKEGSVNLTWTAAQNAVSYRVEIQNFHSGKWINKHESTELTVLNYGLTLEAGCYRAMVVAYNGIKENSSEYQYFNLSGKPGDFDCDGEATDADAIYLLRAVTLDYPLNQNGDLNKDGVVTDADAIYMLRHTLFPSQYPLA